MHNLSLDERPWFFLILDIPYKEVPYKLLSYVTLSPSEAVRICQFPEWDEYLFCTFYAQLAYFLFIQVKSEHKTHSVRNNEDLKKCLLEILPHRGFVLEKEKDMYMN